MRRLSKIDDRCVDFRRSMCRPSEMDVDLRRSVIDVPTFEDRCEIRLLYLLKILILYIAVCELRRGFALQCFHCNSTTTATHIVNPQLWITHFLGGESLYGFMGELHPCTAPQCAVQPHHYTE